jgi:hypothetical protein
VFDVKGAFGCDNYNIANQPHSAKSGITFVRAVELAVSALLHITPLEGMSTVSRGEGVASGRVPEA